MAKKNAIKETAREFATKWNVRVFPMEVVEGDDRGEKKVPVQLDNSEYRLPWKRRASSDVDSFSDSEWSRADGYAVVPDGYTVLDFDGPGVAQSFGELVGLSLPETLIVSTPRKGGYHVWLKGESTNGGHPVPKMDVRSGGDGYIIGPGSWNPMSGKQWSILQDSTIAPLPEKFRRVIDAKERRTSSLLRDHESSFAELAEQHGRNNTLTTLKGSFVRLGLSEEMANDLVRVANGHLVEPLSERELEGTVFKEKSSWEVGNLLSRDVMLDVAFSEFISSKDLSMRPPPKYIIEKIFPEGTVSVIYGAPGSYKSFIAMDLAARIADGRALPSAVPSMPQLQVMRPMRTLYVAAEGVGGIPKRLKAAGIEDSNLMWFGSGLDMRNREVAAKFVEAMVDSGVELVFFDTLRKISPGAEENSVKDMGELMSILETMATEIGIQSVLIHHSNRGEGAGYRGSSVIEADVYNMWKVVRDEDEPMVVDFESVKFKDAEPISLSVSMGVSNEYDSLYVDSYSYPMEESAATEVAHGNTQRAEQQRIIDEALNDGEEWFDILRTWQGRTTVPYPEWAQQ